MNYKIIIGLLGLSLLPAFSFSQIYKKTEIDIEAFAEELFSIQEEEINYGELYESLLQVYLNPVNLNKTNAEELQALYILNPIQINSFMDYREKYGPLLSLYELQAVPEFNLEIIYRLLPFVTLDDGEGKASQSITERIITEKNAYLMIRHRRVWETRRGFSAPDTLNNGRLSSRYLGDPQDLYVRFRIQHAKDFSLGFTLDKDAGEEFRWDHASKRYGFNFLSYHFTFYQKGRWKAITLGDFQAQYGQGLVFGSGYSVGKGAEAITTVKRSSIGIRPYTSVMEYGFFRGGAATYTMGNIEISALLSNAPRDGNIQSLTDTLENQEDFISSLLLSGYHRTPTEIGNKSKAREQNLGGNISYKSDDGAFHFGINSLFSNYSQPFIRADRIYNGFEFRGKYNHIHSTYFSYNYQNYFFFGESAISKSGGMGNVIGLMASLTPHFDVSVLYRSFDRDFHSFYGNAFSEGTRPINEKGTYLGLQYRPNRKINWSMNLDRFHFPWLRFRAYAPSVGHEWLNRVTFSPHKSMALFFQMREEVKDRNISDPERAGAGYQMATGKRRNYATSLNLIIDKRWSIKSRIQFSSYDFNRTKTKGYAILQEISADWERFRLSGRIALFDTDDYENRQYVYEKNVLWAFSIPNYHGQGMRHYLLGEYKVNRKLTFWARWARTSFTDREEIGSGLQTIQGSKISETTFQMRYQFNQ
ncbi:MAG: helix-hairpin-helix domain-containing protein [Anditalea sp.]